MVHLCCDMVFVVMPTITALSLPQASQGSARHRCYSRHGQFSLHILSQVVGQGLLHRRAFRVHLQVQSDSIVRTSNNSNDNNNANNTNTNTSTNTNTTTPTTTPTPTPAQKPAPSPVPTPTPPPSPPYYHQQHQHQQHLFITKNRANNTNITIKHPTSPVRTNTALYPQAGVFFFPLTCETTMPLSLPRFATANATSHPTNPPPRTVTCFTDGLSCEALKTRSGTKWPNGASTNNRAGYHLVLDIIGNIR